MYFIANFAMHSNRGKSDMEPNFLHDSVHVHDLSLITFNWCYHIFTTPETVFDKVT